MTLLDFGLAEELTPAVRHHFISFLHAIAAGGPTIHYMPSITLHGNVLCAPTARFQDTGLLSQSTPPGGMTSLSAMCVQAMASVRRSCCC